MHKEIKSYVLRKGRISNRQQWAFDHWLPDYALDLKDEPWNFSAIFSNTNPVIVEIGFGMGHSLIEMAKKNPQYNYIGIEVHQAGVGSLIADVHELGLTNIKVIMDDAVVLFKNYIPKASLMGVQIFFPDPWHKKRHNKRRLIQPPFVSLLTDCLQSQGFIHAATDWEDYALQMLSFFDQEKRLKNSQDQGGFALRTETRPLTKFEQRGLKLGHGVWDLLYFKL